MGIVCAYRHSIIGKSIKAVADRESSADHSVFVRVIKILFKKWIRQRSASLLLLADGKIQPFVFAAGEIARMSHEKLSLLFSYFRSRVYNWQNNSKQDDEKRYNSFCLSLITQYYLR